MIRDEQEQLADLALGIALYFHPAEIHEFLSYVAQAELSLGECLRLSPEKLRKIIPKGSGLHHVINRLSSSLGTAKDLALSLSQKDTGWFSYRDEIYPKRILRFMGESAPFLFFYRGNPELLRRDSFLGIVGTRTPSPKGILAACETAKLMAEKGIVIVSGGAKGIDTAAHKGGLKKGSTIFILPSGIHRINRLDEFKKDFNPENHLIISEFHPDERGTRSTPILRNRTVAALSDTILIAETGWRGGTLHTLRMAREFGKPVLVFDYSPAKNPQGNASLITTIGGALPLLDKTIRIAAIIQALQKGASLLEKNSDLQTTLFS